MRRTYYVVVVVVVAIPDQIFFGVATVPPGEACTKRRRGGDGSPRPIFWKGDGVVRGEEGVQIFFAYRGVQSGSGWRIYTILL